MTELNRRSFLAMAGAAAAASALAACTNGGGSDTNTDVLKWWDQFQPISAFEKKTFEKFGSSKGGLKVQYTVQNPSTFARELQLAYQSKQLPDVFTLAVTLPTPALQKENWFSPLQLDNEHKKLLPEGTLVSGQNMFDGKPYSFPIFTFRSHDTLLWINKDLAGKAGVDPDNLPTSYDDIRAAARAIQNKNSKASGWIAPIKLPDRLQSQVAQMALAAGSPASLQGVSFKTGEYVFDSDEWINAIEFFVAMKKDGVMFPASTTLDARTARARWATGVAGIFFDGSYNMGVLKSSFPTFVEKVAVGAIPVPQKDQQVSISGVSANPALSLWIAKNSKHADVASRLVSLFATDEVQTGIAEAMDQPPLISHVLAKADVAPQYRQAIEIFNKEVFSGPVPVVRNPAVASVAAKAKQVQPTLGQIVAGAITGDISDWKGALKKFNTDNTRERDSAIKTVTSAGQPVSADDWKFPDWKPGVDYVTKPK